jgi:hypothetical protein
MSKTIKASALQVAIAAASMLGVLGAASTAVAKAPPVTDKVEQISFDLVPNPAFVECLRASYKEEPRAHATIIRGQLNDTLILDLDGIKPGLQFDLFTVQRSPFLSSGAKDPTVKAGDFGLAWYQSDIEIPMHADHSRTTIKTILLDQIFGFDPEVGLKPTNTFHLGFWFNNPEDAEPCNPGPVRPLAPTPFNGEHKAGPLAMISTTNVLTHLGPLCTDPTGKNPPSCNP